MPRMKSSPLMVIGDCRRGGRPAVLYRVWAVPSCCEGYPLPLNGWAIALLHTLSPPPLLRTIQHRRSTPSFVQRGTVRVGDSLAGTSCAAWTALAVVAFGSGHDCCARGNPQSVTFRAPAVHSTALGLVERSLARWPQASPDRIRVWLLLGAQPSCQRSCCVG